MGHWATAAGSQCGEGSFRAEEAGRVPLGQPLWPASSARCREERLRVSVPPDGLLKHPVSLQNQGVIARARRFNILLSMNDVVADLADAANEKGHHCRNRLLNFRLHAVLSIVDARRFADKRGCLQRRPDVFKKWLTQLGSELAPVDCGPFDVFSRISVTSQRVFYARKKLGESDGMCG